MLRTSRLILREWRAADAEPFAALNRDPEVMEHFPARLSPGKSAALADRIQAHIARHGFGFWAVEAPGVAPFIGFVGLAHVPFEAPFTPAVEMGWRLARAHWGRGYATEAARAAVADGFGRLDLAEIVAFTVPSNWRSRRVMERLGATRDPADDFDHPRLPVVGQFERSGRDMSADTRQSTRSSKNESEIVMTPEMIEAGIRAAWSAPAPPKIVEDQVRKIYLAMEAVKRIGR